MGGRYKEKEGEGKERKKRESGERQKNELSLQVRKKYICH